MNLDKAQRLLYPLLWPFARIYALIMQRRAARYLAKQSPKNISYKSISVGNISWGGSGKTPLVDYLLDFAKSRNLESIVLSRGYGSKGERPLLVNINTPAETCGDEPLMLAMKHNDGTNRIIVDPIRTRGLKYALDKKPTDIIILDDGMQHLAIPRDINLVVLKASDMCQHWNRVIPAGPWREDKSALKRADAFLLRVSLEKEQELLHLAESKLRDFNKPIFCFDLIPSCLQNISKYQQSADITVENDHIPEQTTCNEYTLLTAVGTPLSVEKSAVKLLGTEPKRRLFFPDHHSYSHSDISKALGFGLPVICTEKDAVKIAQLIPQAHQNLIWVLDAKVCFTEKTIEQDFSQWLEQEFIK